MKKISALLKTNEAYACAMGLRSKLVTCRSW